MCILTIGLLDKTTTFHTYETNLSNQSARFHDAMQDKRASHRAALLLVSEHFKYVDAERNDDYIRYQRILRCEISIKTHPHFIDESIKQSGQHTRHFSIIPTSTVL